MPVTPPSPSNLCHFSPMTFSPRSAITRAKTDRSTPSSRSFSALHCSASISHSVPTIICVSRVRCDKITLSDLSAAVYVDKNYNQIRLLCHFAFVQRELLEYLFRRLRTRRH